MDDQQRMGLTNVRQEKPNVLFDVKSCVICQTLDSNKTVTTIINGRKIVQKVVVIGDIWVFLKSIQI